MDGTKVGIKHLDIFICDWVIFHGFFSHFLIFFQNKLFRKILSGILSECQCFVRPDLGPNCLQKLSADVTRRYRVKRYAYMDWYMYTLEVIIFYISMLHYANIPIDAKIDNFQKKDRYVYYFSS